MNPLIVRGVAIGAGIPKICVSLTSKSDAELLEDAEACAIERVDLVEWRVDHFENLEDLAHMIDLLSELRGVIIDKPLIFTYRTVHEGGAETARATQIRGERSSCEKSQYVACLKMAIASGLIDLVDVELFMGDEIVRELTLYAHAYNVKVIVSNHDFSGMPKLEEMVARVQKMQELGGDILKIAVMPLDKKDVLTLLEATVILSEQHPERPIVTIAMSDLGVISRVTGEVFGSSITFGQLGKLSAPGQIAVSELSELLMRLHHLLPNENKL